MFTRPYRMTLNHVHDTVRITEGGESLTLHVDADPMRLTTALHDCVAAIKACGNDTPEEQWQQAALEFAGAIFGAAQAKALLDFYRLDGVCVINICGQYFQGRLTRLIDKAQRKAKK